MPKKQTPPPSPLDCFVLMPISDQEGYPENHFTRVYEDIIKPACGIANAQPHRADETQGTNLIHLDILKSLLDAPIAICDLSSRNPNVLFELGIRQAFDKPVVLIKDDMTPDIFDISALRYVKYSNTLSYRSVVQAQNEIADSIKSTIEQDSSKINSIVQLLAIDKATVPDISESKDEQLLRLILSKMGTFESAISYLSESNKIIARENDRLMDKMYSCIPIKEKNHKSRTTNDTYTSFYDESSGVQAYSLARWDNNSKKK